MIDTKDKDNQNQYRRRHRHHRHSSWRHWYNVRSNARFINGILNSNIPKGKKKSSVVPYSNKRESLIKN